MGVIVLFLTVFICGRHQLLDEKFVELSTCPACYGQSICPEMLQQQNVAVSTIQLSGVSSLRVFKILNYKNVYFGCSDKVTLVLKKLAHDSELHEFDKKICDITKVMNCNVSEVIDYLVKKNNYNVSQIVDQHLSLFTSDGIMCNHTRILQYLYRKYTNIDSGPYHQQHFLTMLAVNFEPLLINVSM